MKRINNRNGNHINRCNYFFISFLLKKRNYKNILLSNKTNCYQKDKGEKDEKFQQKILGVENYISYIQFIHYIENTEINKNKIKIKDKRSEGI